MARNVSRRYIMSEATTKVPYQIKVHNLEVCNCSHGCGCQFAGFPSSKDGSCEAIIGYEVIDGHYGDVDLTGCRLVVAAKWPKAIHEGGGQCALFIDESCSPEQVEGLAMIYSGQAGGMPWEALAGTIGKMEGPILKPIEMTIDGTKSSFRIPGGSIVSSPAAVMLASALRNSRRFKRSPSACPVTSTQARSNDC